MNKNYEILDSYGDSITFGIVGLKRKELSITFDYEDNNVEMNLNKEKVEELISYLEKLKEEL